MPSSNYLVTEPHPSVPRSSYIHAGRGGAGNYARYKPEELTKGPSASGPASRTTISPPPPSTRFTSGRGGAGNTFTRKDSQRAIFSFDEELAHEQKLMDARSKAPVYHIGRGGAGNAVDEMKPNGRSGSASSVSSDGSSTSDKARRSFSGAFRTLSRTLSRN